MIDLDKIKDKKHREFMEKIHKMSVEGKWQTCTNCYESYNPKFLKDSVCPKCGTNLIPYLES